MDLELAEERKIQRQRQEEGSTFADKEKFVTQSYLQRQKELRLLEEEEKKMEANSTGNSTQFYKGILEEASELRGGLVIPNKKKNVQDHIKQIKQVESIKSNVQIAIDQGKVQLNDSMEIIDKRQLLSGGLNVPIKTIQKQEQQQELKSPKEGIFMDSKKDKQEMARKRIAMENKNNTTLGFNFLEIFLFQLVKL